MHNPSGRAESRILTDSKGFQWRILLFSNGNEPKNAGHISVFLKLQKPGSMPPGCRARQLHIDFAVLHTMDIKRSMRSEGGPIFYSFPLNTSNIDYGLPRGFSRANLLQNPRDYMSEGGYIVVSVKAEDIGGGGTISQQAKRFDQVSTTEPAQGQNGELLKYESGSMVGLRNQGATCYMNSLLQTLFHIRQLRKAVYSMPTEDEHPVTGVSLALQRTFFRLESSTEAVSTKDLTKSFGWDAYDSFLQQDVQELNRVLCDRIEEKMKDTPVAGTIKRLFAGKTLSFVNCVDVDYSSSREEEFYDLQLDVKGCKDIMESFDKYTEEEVLDGEDKYDAGPELGKQKARKGTKFLLFPPVLTIHLKRFEYNAKTHAMVKVNDRFEFPFKLNISKYLAEQGPKMDAQDSEYILHSVLVHSGDVHGGHYYAYIRPSDSVQNDNWVKFNDEHVSLVDHDEAIEDSCGGEGSAMDSPDPFNFWPMNRCLNSIDGGCTSAYMLVYMRKTALPSIMANFTVPESLGRRLRDEDEAREKLIKEEREAHLFCKMRVATDRDVSALRTYRVHQDFADFDECLEIRVKKVDNVFEVLKDVSAALDVPLNQLRVWNVTDRENGTARPDDPLEGKVLTMCVVDYFQLAQLRWGGSTGTVKLYAEIHDEGGGVEVEPAAGDADDGHRITSANQINTSLLLPTIPPNSCMLYFKFFDPTTDDEALQLRYVGRHLVLSKSDTVQELLPIMASMADLPGDTPLLVFEGVTVANICQLAPNSTMLENELQHGDILCFQLDNTDSSQLCSLNNGIDGEGGNNQITIDHQATEHSSIGGCGEPVLISKAVAKRRRLRKAVATERREMRDGVSRMIVPLNTVKDFFSMVTKRIVVHFVPRSTSGGLYLPHGRTTVGGAPGVSMELLRSSTLREMCEALAQELELVEDPLSLFFCPPESSYNLCPVPVSDLNTSLDTVMLDKLFLQSSKSCSCYTSRAPKESHPRYTLQFEVLPFPAPIWATHKVLEVTVLDRHLVESYRLMQEQNNPIVQKQMSLKEMLMVSPASELTGLRNVLLSPSSEDLLEDNSSIFESPKSSSGRSDYGGEGGVAGQQQDLSTVGMEMASCDLSSK